MSSARAAVYAALVDAGATPRHGAPSATDAAAFAKRIRLAWADHGFRGETGAFRNTDEKYCDHDPDGKSHVAQFGTFVSALTHARGVIYSVHAQGLLQGITVLTRDEQTGLDLFHHNMVDVIRAIHNQEYDLNRTMRYSDEVYITTTRTLAISQLVFRWRVFWTTNRPLTPPSTEATAAVL